MCDRGWTFTGEFAGGSGMPQSYRNVQIKLNQGTLKWKEKVGDHCKKPERPKTRKQEIKCKGEY